MSSKKKKDKDAKTPPRRFRKVQDFKSFLASKSKK
jgi:hypothetical protein